MSPEACVVVLSCLEGKEDQVWWTGLSEIPLLLRNRRCTTKTYACLIVWLFDEMGATWRGLGREKTAAISQAFIEHRVEVVHLRERPSPSWCMLAYVSRGLSVITYAEWKLSSLSCWGNLFVSVFVCAVVSCGAEWEPGASVEKLSASRAITMIWYIYRYLYVVSASGTRGDGRDAAAVR